MDLTPETVAGLAAAYPDLQPLASVESEHLEVLPTTFASGDYGWRDAEWVVQWYFRRFLGAYPDADRRAAESAFGENDYEDVHAAIAGALEAESTAAKLDQLDDLTGVDVSVASAFLQFLEPTAYLVMSPVEWSVLQDVGVIDGPYPDESTADGPTADEPPDDGPSADGTTADRPPDDGPSADGPTADDYRRYLDTCVRIADDCDADLWTVYRALWVRWYRESGEIPSV